jgi:hypothetical protein
MWLRCGCAEKVANDINAEMNDITMVLTRDYLTVMNAHYSPQNCLQMLIRLSIVALSMKSTYASILLPLGIPSSPNPPVPTST